MRWSWTKSIFKKFHIRGARLMADSSSRIIYGDCWQCAAVVCASCPRRDTRKAIRIRRGWRPTTQYPIRSATLTWPERVHTSCRFPWCARQFPSSPWRDALHRFVIHIWAWTRKVPLHRSCGCNEDGWSAIRISDRTSSTKYTLYKSVYSVYFVKLHMHFCATKTRQTYASDRRYIRQTQIHTIECMRLTFSRNQKQAHESKRSGA